MNNSYLRNLFLAILFLSWACNNLKTDSNNKKKEILEEEKMHSSISSPTKKSEWCIYKRYGANGDTSFKSNVSITIIDDSIIAYLISKDTIYKDILMKPTEFNQIFLRKNKFAIVKKNDSALAYYPYGLDGAIEFYKICSR